MSFIRIISVCALLVLSACDVTVYSGSDGYQAAVNNGMPTPETVGDFKVPQSAASLPASPVRVWDPQPIVAFDSKQNLIECIDRLTSFPQLLAADDGSLVAGGKCSFGAPPVNRDDISFEGFHESGTHIFAIIRIDLPTDGADRYSFDSMLPRNKWRLTSEIGLNACTRRQVATYGGCIVPRDCGALTENWSGAQVNLFGGGVRYFRQPARCTAFSS